MKNRARLFLPALFCLLTFSAQARTDFACSGKNAEDHIAFNTSVGSDKVIIHPTMSINDAPIDMAGAKIEGDYTGFTIRDHAGNVIIFMYRTKFVDANDAADTGCKAGDLHSCWQAEVEYTDTKGTQKTMSALCSGG